MAVEFHSRREADDPAGSSSPATPNTDQEISAAPAKKLRLLYISNPNIIHTRRWVGWFAWRGHTVCLLADVPPRVAWPEVQVINLSEIFHAPVIRFPVWAVWLKRFIHQWQPDVLHAHRVNSAGWLAAASGFHPYVVTPWGSDVFLGPQRSRLARLLARYTLRHADQVTTISQAIRQRVIELGARTDRLSSVHHGVNLDVFSPKSQEDQAGNSLRQTLSLPAAAPLIFSPRAAHPIYNLDIIMQAIPLVKQRFPEAYFIFTDYNTDPRYKDELEKLSKSLGVREQVRWLPPTASPTEMAERYLSSDVIVSVPSSDGGTPVTVMEAMACGKPVICSDLPAPREFITNGENGWLVPVRQADPLAEAIVRVLEDPTRAAEFGRKAHQIVAERASLDVQMQHMEAIYYQLAGMGGV